MSVHYKFKSNLDYDTVTFDGVHISVSDLKKAIMQQKKIGKSSDFDLQITNAQTEEVYKKDEDLVLKNTSVIVARVPVVSTGKKSWEKPELPLPLDDGDKGHIRFDKLVKSADIANTNATEDDKVKAMISQSSQEYDPSKYVKSRSMTGPLPPAYTCFRCGKQGHWIKNCPTNNLDIKRSTGIPRSFMVPVDGPEHKGALLTSSGDYAVPIIDHHAYKEVKKEKPPFIFEPEAPPEPEAEIPEELLCMFCKSLLQEAVLIPCCGNSFCDECVRQALLDSDNHECPVCHEIDISPDTVIPNRFLRTAVLNFKNETGYTRVKKLFQPVAATAAHIDSPQPSPDSTVENQLMPGEQNSVDIKDEFPEPMKEEPVLIIKPEKEEIDEVEEGEMENDGEKLPQESEELVEEEDEDASPPGTPLADEPVDDSSETLPIQQVGLDDYDDYRPSSFRSHRYRDDYDNDTPDEDSEPRQISTIETITNVRRKFGGRPLPNMQSNMHHHRQQHYSTGMLHRDRQHDYEQRGREFHGRYDRRNQNERPLLRGHRMNRYDMSQNDRYHHQDNRRDYTDYTGESRHIREPRYDTHLPSMESRRPVRYASPPLPTVVPPAAVPVPVAVPTQIDIASQYGVQPTAVSASQPMPTLLPPTQAPSFPPQPPPPGASPIDHSSHIPPQPPPPGVGPLLSSSVLPEAPQSSSFSGPPFKSEEVKPKQEERSIDDRMEAFQRELDKRASERVRDRASRSSSRSRKRSRSTSRSSHSRSYSSSKSWSRTSSRSLTRSSRSRSRASYSSRSRSRSYSRSRSRSKSRSYSRSRSRSTDVRQRSKSRSRSREREKRRRNSRDRQHVSYSKNHSPSHSPPLRNYHPRNRQSPYPVRRPYNPPVQYSASSYTAPYNAPTALLPVPVLRTASYAPTHLHSSHPIQTQPVPHTHPIEHYPLERTRYAAYNDPYTVYDMYQHAPKTYGHQRYERDPRTQRYETAEYQKEYPRREDDIQQRIPGWVGDRNRDYRPRFRQVRDQQRKEIKELPKLCEPEVKSEIRVREPKEKQDYIPKRKEDTNSRRREEVNEKKKEEINAKKKEEKVSAKHKKHRHRSKENKKFEKQESKIPVVVSTDSAQDLITVQVQPDNGKAVRLNDEESPAKVPEKVKEKKHKHKKHKMEEQVAKKKKVAKKEKVDMSENSETSAKAKTKKRRNKVKALIKALEETKKREKSGSKHSKRIKLESTEKPEAEVAKIEDPDVLTVTADDLNLETENHDDYTDDVIKLHTSTEDFELDLEATEESEINHEKEATVPEEGKVQTLESQENTKPVEPTDKDTSVNASLQEEEEEEEEEAIDDATAYEQDALPEEDNELHVEVPELSKWEREELEDEDISKPQRKSTVVIPKSTKGIATLSSDIIQRAEKVIMQKPLKTAIVQGSSSNGKEKIKSEKKPMNKVDSPIDSTSSKHSEVKSTSDRARSPNLQVTISTEKEKRSVQAKDETQQQQPRRFKLDRSSFKSIEPPKPPSTSHRTVVIEEPLVMLKKSDEKPQRKVENRTVIAKREHTKIHGPDYKPENESKSLTSRSGKEIVKTGNDRKRDYDRHNRRSRSQENSRRKDGVTSDRHLTREESDFYRTQKDIHTVVTDYDRSARRYVNTQSSRSGAPPKESYKRSHSQSSNSNDNPHYLSKRQNVSSDSRRHEYRSDHHSHHDRSERHKKARSPSSSHSPKKSQNKKQSAVRMVSVTANKGGEKYSSTYDESKFEPDYDEFSDTNPREAGKEKNKLNLGSEIQGNVSHKWPKVTEKEQRKLEKRKTASSSSGASSSSSDSESEDSTDEKTVRHKSSDIEHKRHKKSKHKKHKKHKHKKKKSHKSKVRT